MFGYVGKTKVQEKIRNGNRVVSKDLLLLYCCLIRWLFTRVAKRLAGKQANKQRDSGNKSRRPFQQERQCSDREEKIKETEIQIQQHSSGTMPFFVSFLTSLRQHNCVHCRENSS